MQVFYFSEILCSRHKLELEGKEETKILETLKKELEIHMKNVKTIEKNLKISQDDLESYQVCKNTTDKTNSM